MEGERFVYKYFDNHCFDSSECFFGSEMVGIERYENQADGGERR